MTIIPITLAHGASLPAYATNGAAGMDLRAAEQTVLHPGCRGLVSTGIHISIPEGFEGQIRPRSGMALHHGVTVLNAPGTVDPDFRGEVKVLLINHGVKVLQINIGDRIAQLVIAPVARAVWQGVGELAGTGL